MRAQRSLALAILQTKQNFTIESADRNLLPPSLATLWRRLKSLENTCDLKTNIEDEVNLIYDAFSQVEDLKFKLFRDLSTEYTSVQLDTLDNIIHAIEEYAKPKQHEDMLNIKKRKFFESELEYRFKLLATATNRFVQLGRKMRKHVEKRERRNENYLMELSLDDDIFPNIIKQLNVKSAIQLARTCNAMRRNVAIKQRIPHLHIRNLIGTFPHAQKIQQMKLENIIIAKKNITLYVDFRTIAMNKLPIIAFELLDAQNPHKEHTKQYQSEEKRKLKRKRKFIEALGPQEVGEKNLIAYDAVFNNRPNFKASLVFADTHEPVPCKYYSGAIKPSKELWQNGNMFTQQKIDGCGKSYWVEAANSILPAKCTISIKKVSKEFNGRQFKICVQATMHYNWRLNIANTTLAAYSTPFTVVSKLKK